MEPELYNHFIEVYVKLIHMYQALDIMKRTTSIIFQTC